MRAEFNIQTEELGEMVPRQLIALLDEKARRDRAEDYRFGVVAAQVRNGYMSQKDPKKKKGYQPSDFFLSLRQKPDTQSWQEQFAMVQQLHIAFKGKGKVKPLIEPGEQPKDKGPKPGPKRVK